jgi:hypothetical protein
MSPPSEEEETGRRRRRPRWGWRTLGFLVLGMVALTVGGIQGHNTFGTIGCTVVGLVGAAYCSYRGVQSLINLEWVDRRRT